jgi:hypothetical protein
MARSLRWAEMLLVFHELRREELRRALRASTTRGGRWRCGLCGRSFLVEESLLRHAVRSHPREYEEAVRRALAGVTLRFGGVPKWFVKCYASPLLGKERGRVEKRRNDGRARSLLFYG